MYALRVSVPEESKMSKTAFIDASWSLSTAATSSSAVNIAPQGGAAAASGTEPVSPASSGGAASRGEPGAGDAISPQARRAADRVAEAPLGLLDTRGRGAARRLLARSGRGVVHVT